MRADGSRALRALVAEMAQLGDADLQAILDDLDPGARARLTALIETFRTGDGPAGAPAAMAAAAPGDWLLARLQPRDPAAPGLTPHAQQALRRAAQAAGWTGAPPPSAAAPNSRGLLARLGLRP